jgi:hypothetical protein
MSQMLDCLVSYFGLDEEEQPVTQRYFSYQIVAGPGPTAGTGVAAIATLAVHNEAQRCTYCQHFHVVKAGGPAAAIAAAVRYLDAYHEADHLRKVQSDIRGLDTGPSTKAVPLRETPSRASRGSGLLRKV